MSNFDNREQLLQREQKRLGFSNVVDSDRMVDIIYKHGAMTDPSLPVVRVVIKKRIVEERIELDASLDVTTY